MFAVPKSIEMLLFTLNIFTKSNAPIFPPIKINFLNYTILFDKNLLFFAIFLKFLLKMSIF